MSIEIRSLEMPASFTGDKEQAKSFCQQVVTLGYRSAEIVQVVDSTETTLGYVDYPSALEMASFVAPDKSMIAFDTTTWEEISF